MLNEHEAVATVAVRDMRVASDFYENTLGLKRVAEQGAEAYTYQTGSTKVLVYHSQFAGTNQATAVTWVIGAKLEALVKSLGAKGVTFEHYDMPETKREGDIHIAGNTRVAWFKDPDGNIHSLVNGTSV
jgi:catechol 2,3-dioxygenase-like lactoylglutathione lyase family enzyme